MMFKRFSIILTLLVLTKCIGVDYIDDPIVDPELIIQPRELALSLGDKASFTGSYLDEYAVEQVTSLSWGVKDPSILSITDEGEVEALSSGQSYVYLYSEGLIDSSLVTVVGDASAVSNVGISAPKTELLIGEQVQLTVVAKNILNETLPDKIATYRSSNTSVLSVSSTGILEALALGEATITGEVDGISSLPLKFIIGSTSLTGMLQGTSGYVARGTVTLMRNASNELILSFSSDFETSFALGTFVYLANTTSGGQVRSQGLELAEVTSNGAKSFNVSAIDSNVGLTTYQYVIILCKPASITFGFAELN